MPTALIFGGQPPARLLGYSAADARRDGEWPLLRAHRPDPVGDSWLSTDSLRPRFQARKDGPQTVRGQHRLGTRLELTETNQG
jgi:hypothetical protein